jgi:hypothetical protein
MKTKICRTANTYTLFTACIASSRARATNRDQVPFCYILPSLVHMKRTTTMTACVGALARHHNGVEETFGEKSAWYTAFFAML